MFLVDSAFRRKLFGRKINNRISCTSSPPAEKSRNTFIMVLIVYPTVTEQSSDFCRMCRIYSDIHRRIIVTSVHCTIFLNDSDYSIIYCQRNPFSTRIFRQVAVKKLAFDQNHSRKSVTILTNLVECHLRSNDLSVLDGHARARTSECVGIASEELQELILGRLQSCDKDGARQLSAADRQTEHEKTQQNEIDACRSSLAVGGSIRFSDLSTDRSSRAVEMNSRRARRAMRSLLAGC